MAIELRCSCSNKNDYKGSMTTWKGRPACAGNRIERRQGAERPLWRRICRSATAHLTGGPTPGSVVNPNALYAVAGVLVFPYVPGTE